VRLLICSTRIAAGVNNTSLDNEFAQNPISHAEYFAELKYAYDHSGIVVPLTYNDPGEGRNFVNGTVSILLENL
jgi:hypothetical protein